MGLREFARETVITVSATTSVTDAAKRMKKYNVGSLVVTERNKVIGIVTDRDLAMRVLAADKNANALSVGDVMTKNPVVLEEDLGLFEALEIMKDKGIRRFPVIDHDGNLSAFFTVDDVLNLIGMELSAVTRIIDAETPELLRVQRS